MSAEELAPLGFCARWTTYFRERFPPLQYAVAMGIFSFATLAYAAASAGMTRLPSAYPSFVAFAVAFLTFLQLRIHDEFKDLEDDRRFRPERPVPRGLITLQGLSRLGLLAAAVQFTLSVTLGWHLVALLAVIQAYSWLMRVEFFVRDWLKGHAGAYLLSHMVIVPLITLYVATCASALAIEQLGWYLAFSYCNFCVFETGRKVWSPDEERPGVETYTALWGRSRAVVAWLGAIYASGATGTIAAYAAGGALAVAATGSVIALLATAIGAWFIRRLAPVRGSWFRALSALWFIGIHAAMGGAMVRAI